MYNQKKNIGKFTCLKGTQYIVIIIILFASINTITTNTIINCTIAFNSNENAGIHVFALPDEATEYNFTITLQNESYVELGLLTYETRTRCPFINTGMCDLMPVTKKANLTYNLVNEEILYSGITSNLVYIFPSKCNIHTSPLGDVNMTCPSNSIMYDARLDKYYMRDKCILEKKFNIDNSFISYVLYLEIFDNNNIVTVTTIGDQKYKYTDLPYKLRSSCYSDTACFIPGAPVAEDDNGEGRIEIIKTLCIILGIIICCTIIGILFCNYKKIYECFPKKCCKKKSLIVEEDDPEAKPLIGGYQPYNVPYNDPYKRYDSRQDKDISIPSLSVIG